MKTSFLKLTLLAALGFFVNIKTTVAQSCDFSMVNSLACTISGTIDYYDNCAGLPPCSTVSFSGQAASSNVTYHCSGCHTLCNVVVTITSIGGTSITSNNTADINNTETYGTSSCGSAGAQFHLHWDGASAYINSIP